VLALAQPAEAKIVYTPAHTKIPFMDPVYIDLNHDGKKDFQFYWAVQDVGSFLNVHPVNSYNQVWGTGQYTRRLHCGMVQIHTNTRHFRPHHTLMASFAGSTLVYHGQWLSAHPRYLGFKFFINGRFTTGGLASMSLLQTGQLKQC